MTIDTISTFENRKIRRLYNENTETWLFSVVDIIQALIQQTDYQMVRKYWNKLKERLKKKRKSNGDSLSPVENGGRRRKVKINRCC